LSGRFISISPTSSLNLENLNWPSAGSRGRLKTNDDESVKRDEMLDSEGAFSENGS
jgi:hypothetical protein